MSTSAGERPGRHTPEEAGPASGTGRVLVLQHLAAEHLGTIGEHLRSDGFEAVVVELDEGERIPPLEGFDLLVAMGGPMNVWEEDEHPWLVGEKAAIRRWVRTLGRPFLGVCLGHQLLADALGGEVGPMAEPEVGVCPVVRGAGMVTDPLAGGLPSSFRVLQWHGAEVRRLPPGGVVLASSPACAVQAFHVPPLAWGLQFHAEVGPSTVAEWAAVPVYREALATIGLGEGSVAGLEALVAEHAAAMEATSARLADALAALVRRSIAVRRATDADPAGTVPPMRAHPVTR